MAAPIPSTLIPFVTMPAEDQGISTDRYLLIPRTLLFVTCEDTVLLLKGGAHKRLWAGLYNGVGGHVERGEDVRSAARRELLEETGLDVTDLWLCGTVTVDSGEDVGIGIFVFRGEYSQKEDVSAELSSPDGELEWVPVDRVFGLPLVEDLPVLLPRVLAAQPDQPPFAAHSAFDQAGRLVLSFG